MNVIRMCILRLLNPVAKHDLALPIQLEPCLQRGLFFLSSSLDFATIAVINPLAILKMKIKSNHRVRIEVCLEAENAVGSLNSGHILRLEVSLDLISILAEANVCHITTLMDIRIEILADLGTGRAQFHVDVSIILEDQVLVSRDDPFVRVPLAIFGNHAALVTTSVNREVVGDICLLIILLRKAFPTNLPVYRIAIPTNNIAHREGVIVIVIYCALPNRQFEVVIILLNIKKTLDVVSIDLILISIIQINLSGLSVQMDLIPISIIQIDLSCLTIEVTLCCTTCWLIIKFILIH